MPARILPLLTVLAAIALLPGCRNGELTTRAIVTMNLPPDPGLVEPLYVDGPHAPSKQVAVIDIDTPLLTQPGPNSLFGGDTPVSQLRERLKAAANNPHTCAVVLRINSPGGSVTATEIMVRELHAFRQQTGLPVVACLMDLGTGGAYYLATASDVVVAHPTTVTGGIGVIVNLFNLRETMAAMNVFDQSIKSGEYIDMGTDRRALDEATEAMLQRMSDDFHQRFINAVRASRPRLTNADVVFSGRIFSGQQALEYGLVDHVGFLDDAIDIARQSGGCPKAQVVMYRRDCDTPHSVYETSGEIKMPTLIPFNMPGLSRKSLPLFLYMWLPELTMQ